MGTVMDAPTARPGIWTLRSGPSSQEGRQFKMEGPATSLPVLATVTFAVMGTPGTGEGGENVTWVICRSGNGGSTTTLSWVSLLNSFDSATMLVESASASMVKFPAKGNT